jgi:hypothetical protein
VLFCERASRLGSLEQFCSPGTLHGGMDFGNIFPPLNTGDCYTEQDAGFSHVQIYSLENQNEAKVCVMKFSSGDHWCCQNDACGCEITVVVSSKLEGENPRCSCGSVMKKAYTKPRLRDLPGPTDLRDKNSQSWLRFLKQSTP